MTATRQGRRFSIEFRPTRMHGLGRRSSAAVASLVLLGLVAGPCMASDHHSTSVEGVPLHWISQGEGRAIILVHGWTCDSSVWAHQLADLARDYRVIALDLPGHGRSGSPPDGIFTMELFSRSLEAVRREAGVDRVVLVGHSLGASVIREYAIRHPDRVLGIVGLDGSVRAPAERPSVPPPSHPREAVIQQMFLPSTPKQLREQITRLMLNTPDAKAAAIAASMVTRTPGAELTDVPILVVLAGNSTLPGGTGLPNAEFTRLAATGHFLMMEAPVAFNSLLRRFLENLEP